MSLRDLLSKIFIIGFLCTCQTNGQLQSFTQSEASACVPSSVEKFSATFYSNLLAARGNDINFAVELPEPTAAALVYKVIIEELSNRGIPNVEKVAEIFSGGLAKLETFSLPVYYQRSGHAARTLLFQEGYLNCANSESLAVQLFNRVNNILYGLDITNIESYLRASIRGFAQFSDSIGFTDPNRAEKLATILAAELS
ncbi:hypothetical protein JTE90_016570 [Oedothorax gibbosus]|uniref:Uncharacterized protein n=1 Tax=Oedothorax gibbosus TaxID=931172 RepID=A0AAV6UCN8_9ARAC|nr:hypothetical protein JTE90_016570 [Oedothorax gibbosus]